MAASRRGQSCSRSPLPQVPRWRRAMPTCCTVPCLKKLGWCGPGRGEEEGAGCRTTTPPHQVVVVVKNSGQKPPDPPPSYRELYGCVPDASSGGSPTYSWHAREMHGPGVDGRS
eukprot:gene25809-biopygen15064